MTYTLFVKGVISWMHNQFRRKSIVRWKTGVVLSLFLILCYYPFPSMAKVTGNCSNCHTMHSSQNGTSDGANSPIDFGEEGSLPNDALTKADCIGCHSNTGPATIVEVGGNPGDPETSRIPIVYNMTQPVNELAGGNFYWMTSASGGIDQAEIDNRGHNVLAGPGGSLAAEGISLKDSVLNDAPGNRIAETGLMAESCYPCHLYLNGRDFNLTLNPALINEPFCGCKSCHTKIQGKHHADDHASADPDDYNNIVHDTMGCYRFLQDHDTAISGVWGIESYDWEQSKGADHPINQYQGSDPAKLSSEQDHSISDHCGGCHGNFHAKDRTNSSGINSSPWMRHPTHIGLPAGGEFNPYTTYSLDAPVARRNLTPYTNPAERSKVNPSGYTGNDQVMCLSCHRAHASQYPDLLRWDYSAIEANNGKSGGCLICHTGKI